MSSLSNADLGWSFRRCLPIGLAVALGVGFSLAVFGLTRLWERRGIERAFLLAAEDRANAVKNAFETDVAMMELVRSSLLSDQRIGREEFRETLEPFLARSQNIQSVEWAPRVSDELRPQYEAAARRDGIENFHFRALGKDGVLTVSPRRDEYFPIYIVGPQENNKAIYGFDMASEPIRFEAIRLARDTGKVVASGQFRLAHEDKPVDGFMVCLPAYEKGKPTDTTAERRRHLQGFILGVFRPSDMIESALRRLQPEGIDVGLYDPSNKKNESRFHFHASRTRDDYGAGMKARSLIRSDGLRYEKPLEVAGRPWTVLCTPSPDFMAAHATWWPTGVLMVGLMFTGFLAGYLILSVHHTLHLEQRVREQTAGLRAAQEDVMCRLASAAQYCDADTSQHVRRIGLMSQALARAVDWFGDDLDAIRQAAPMHDIGKIGVSEKADPQSREDLDAWKKHTRIGGQILGGSDAPMLRMAREIALHHHERWDGRGFPDGLAGRDIPESARIVAIVDAYDLLTHDAPDHAALSENEAVQVLRHQSGTRFDPLLLTAFFRNIAEFRRIAEWYPDHPRNAVSGAAPTTAATVQDWSTPSPAEF